MKKYINLFLIIMMVFYFSTCDFQLPAGIEINGTFENSIPASMNIGAMFTDALDEAFENSETAYQKIYACTQTENKTYLVYVDLFDENILPLAIDVPSFPSTPIPLIDITTPVRLPLSDMSEYMIDFKFKDPDILLYFSGTAGGIFGKIEIEYEVVDSNDSTSKFKSPRFKINDKNSSGLSLTPGENKYTATKPPSNGFLINKDKNDNNKELFHLYGENVDIKFKIYGITGESYSSADFNGSFVVELVVWLPLEFEAVADNAKIILPLDDIFPDDEDLFRRSPDDMSITEMIKSLKLDMVFNKNPFKDGNLVVKSTNRDTGKIFKFEEMLSGNALTINLNEDRMKEINNPDNCPFVPRFEILFKKGFLFGFPQELTVVDLAFRAGVKYGMNW